MLSRLNRLTFALAAAVLAAATLAFGISIGAGSEPAAPLAASTVPTMVSYQGRVLNAGTPFNGTGFFKFAVVSAGGSTSFWSNDGSSAAGSEPAAVVPLTVTSGLFTVLLGDTTLPGMNQPLTATVFVNADRRLRIWFSSSGSAYTQLSPDQAIASVPFALNAQTLAGLDPSAFAPSSHTHAAEDIVTGTLADARLSANVVLSGDNVSRLANDAGYLTSAAGFLSQAQADTRYARLSPTTQQLALLKWYTAIGGSQADFGAGIQPVAIAFDGANMWVANYSTNNVSVLRASDGFHVMTPTAGFNPNGVAFDGANMWVANFTSNNVSVLRASDGFQIMTPTVGTQPNAIAFDGANLWVTNNGSNSVSVLRASDGFHLMTPTVGTQPSAIAFDGANMWVANGFSNNVSVLRASDGFHLMTLTVGTAPRGIAFDGANLWVTNLSNGTVSVLRAADGFHVMTPTVGSFPNGIAFDGANLWVVNSGSGSVSVLRASDGFHVMTPTVGSNPYDIAFDGAFMWVANFNSNTVSKR